MTETPSSRRTLEFKPVSKPFNTGQWVRERDSPAPNKSLELTPSVGALQCLVTSVGICSTIDSSRERSAAPSR